MKTEAQLRGHRNGMPCLTGSGQAAACSVWSPRARMATSQIADSFSLASRLARRNGGSKASAPLVPAHSCASFELQRRRQLSRVRRALARSGWIRAPHSIAGH
eukprot:2898753-Prymnesium_polylepis.1